MASTESRQAHLRDELEADFEDHNELEAPDDQPEAPNKFCEFNSGVAAFLAGGLVLEGLMYLISTPEVPLWSVLPFFFIPFGVLVLCTWFWHYKITTFTNVIQQFLVGGTFVTSCVCIAQMMLIGFWIVFIIGFSGSDGSESNSATKNQTAVVNGTGDDPFNITIVTGDPGQSASSAEELWRDWATFFFLSLVALPMPECAATYLVTVQSNLANHHSKNFVINSLYVGLGYATGQSLLGVISQALREESRYARYVVPEVQWYELLEWAFNYLAMSAPLQMLVGYGVGLLIAEAREKQRPNSWRRCNAVAWVVRAVYYLFYCGWVFLGFWKSWVFITGVLVEALLFIIWIKRVERTMPADYLAKVGYLHMFGYGVLSQVEEVGDSQEMTTAGPADPYIGPAAVGDSRDPRAGGPA
eukprot:EG_transcript_8129